MAIPRQLTAPEQLRLLDRAVEQTSEALQVWEIQFFNATGKWKYTDYVVMTKPERWTEFDVLINNALRDTPREIRETSITEIGDWTVVMINNPYGFPIMVIGSE
ncbi:hypothetical protein SEA_PHEDRO_23 [Microbacterium phage Phedro]|uniref:Uncharacterized protein n=4 Tax=Akonivirus phedro TaxID=2845594 RepID=A0A6M3T3M4_9CAUD|nr:hypothetical protein HWD33_gp23 [Microbacterium phage Phedro]QJD52875.1 hypothetical protein SEA_PHRACTURED_23 [Microbacterium phage Phractured]QJD52930.1 hypothetical protein SEA_PHEDRO_23 [Microbacterium phage Phedro]QJD52985.1 hypothetical protein SEA_PHARKY_23 [Microbacterium phage Pharky]QWY82715.1 hypothetical protein SEA_STAGEPHRIGHT_23 [Microbacterium phage StagePhright]